MRRLTPLLFLVLACATTAVAPPQAVRIPVEIANHRIHIPVSVKGLPPGMFVLDTGAGGSPLNTDYAKEAGVVGTRQGQATGAAGSVAISVARDVPYEFGGIEHLADHVALIPLSPVSLRAGRRVNGILGHDVLNRFVTEIDYAAEQVTFHPPDAYKPPQNAVAVPIEFRHGLPNIVARITLEDGRTLDAKLMVDTGAGAAVILKNHFVEKHKIDTSRGIEASVGLGVGGATKERIGRLARIEVGGIALERPVTMFSQATAGALADPASDGLIGGEVLRRFTFITDYPKKRLLFVPTPAVHDAFEFDMSGVQLTARDTTFSNIDIHQVLPNTPAAEAGLRAGDELRAIDGRPVSVAQLPEIRELFKQLEKTYTLTIVRGGAEQQVTFKTRRIV